MRIWIELRSQLAKSLPVQASNSIVHLSLESPAVNAQPFAALMIDLEGRVRLTLTVCLLLLVIVLLLRLLLPLLLVGGLVSLGYSLWRRTDRTRRQRQIALNQVFYTLLQAQQGRISVLDFAMQAQLSGPQARTYLDAQARAFSAQFEPTPQGDILYIFSLGQLSYLKS